MSETLKRRVAAVKAKTGEAADGKEPLPLRKQRPTAKARSPEQKFRLPHGTRLEADYDGEKFNWKLVFIMPAPDGPVRIELDGTSIHHLIRVGGRRYKKQYAPGPTVTHPADPAAAIPQAVAEDSPRV
jgi:hypothetical protein